MFNPYASKFESRWTAELSELRSRRKTAGHLQAGVCSCGSKSTASGGRGGRCGAQVFQHAQQQRGVHVLQRLLCSVQECVRFQAKGILWTELGVTKPSRGPSPKCCRIYQLPLN